MLGFSSLNKLFIEFEECFWPENIDMFGTFNSPTNGRDLIAVVNYKQYCGGKNILLIFQHPEKSLDYNKMKDE